MTVAAALQQVHERIAAAGGDPAAITVLAVTKGFGPDACADALATGLVELGESRAGELATKAADPALAAARWHFIGHVQTNKVKAAAPHVALWQSVDRAAVVDAIAQRAPGAAVLVQVNASGEPQKSGCVPADAPALVAAARDQGLDVQGVMTIGVAGDDTATARAFTTVVGIADRFDLPIRSLGMSGDLELAVRAGTTMVRIGSALFGARPVTDAVRD